MIGSSEAGHPSGLVVTRDSRYVIEIQMAALPVTATVNFSPHPASTTRFPSNTDIHSGSSARWETVRETANEDQKKFGIRRRAELGCLASDAWFLRALGRHRRGGERGLENSFSFIN